MNAKLDTAIQAFKDNERVSLLKDKKARDLELALMNLPKSYQSKYFRVTTAILAEYEIKREKAGL